MNNFIINRVTMQLISAIINSMSKEKSSAAQYEYMTKTPVSKLIMKLSVPTILSMLGTNIYNLVDTAFVGKLGNSASGAVGVVFGFMAVLQAIGFLFGQGSGSLLSRSLGAKDTKQASRVASTGFFASFTVATVVSIICALNVDWLVRILGSTETIAPYAKTYIYFILSTAPFMVTSFTLNNILRYEGRAALGMIGLISGGVINIAGDAIFMFGLNMGIAGAGLSTAISQVISFCILISMFISGKSDIKISIKNITFENRLPLEIMETGTPSLLRQTLGSLGTIVLNIEAAKYAGDAAVAAMSIVGRVSFFLFAVALGVGQGFQPVCGYNFGAGKYKRLREAYKFTMILAEISIVVLTIAALINPTELIRIFRDDEKVIEIGTRALILQCVGQFFIPFSMVTEMMMQSAGQKKIAAFLSSLRGGVLYIPLLIILPYFRGLSGVEEAQPLAYVLSVFPALYFAKRFFTKLPKDEG